MSDPTESIPFAQRLDNTPTVAEGSDFTECIGLDTNLKLLSADDLAQDLPRLAFNRRIIDLTARHAGAYKPNLAYYGGKTGFEELALTVQYIRENAPQALIILDAKRGDIGATSEAYAENDLRDLNFDAVTLNPYMGAEAIEPFLKMADKGSIILCRTSNPGAGEFQDLGVVDPITDEIIPLYMKVARTVANEWSAKYGDKLMLVAGATSPEEARQIALASNHLSLLIPGIGRQGGDLQALVNAVLQGDQKRTKFAKRGRKIVNSARDIIFAPDPGKAASDFRRNIAEAEERALEVLARGEV
jgi:orotidine-5'-phosphate decarboxylase